MSTLTIIQGNSNDKDNTRAYMVKGERGDDGISPTFETSKTGHTATITITDEDGTHTVTLTDGVSPTVETSKTGGVTTITITDEDGTHTATINDGQTYEVPAGSIIGFDGNTIPAGYEEVQDTFGGGGETLKVGTILEFAGSTAPDNYMFCNGQAISRTQYSDLFDTIGTTYGTGDGSTTFNLPNFKGRVAVGLDSTQTEFDTLGETGGEKTHTLTVNEIPNHHHTVYGNVSVKQGSGNAFREVTTSENANNNVTTGHAGEDQAHNNLQPYITVNYIIKVSKTTATTAQIVDGRSTSTTDGYSCNYVNGLTTYSATEKRIGTWTNNKPLYRSTITFQSTTSPFQYSHGISNIDQIVNFYGYHVRGSETTCRPLQAYNLAYPNYYVSIDSISKTQVELFAGDSVKSSLNWTITIEYTKTTD